jgi:hypothetical protein
MSFKKVYLAEITLRDITAEQLNNRKIPRFEIALEKIAVNDSPGSK